MTRSFAALTHSYIAAVTLVFQKRYLLDHLRLQIVYTVHSYAQQATRSLTDPNRAGSHILSSHRFKVFAILSCVQQSDSHFHSFGCFHISLDLGSADSARFRADFDDGGGGIGIDSIADRMQSAMSE